ncbi:MAG: MATE family efflux transporter [Hydrogenoanaerobacterium sp.]
MLKLIKRFYDTENMIKPEQKLGDLPSTQAAYKRNFGLAWPSALESVLISLVASVDIVMVGVLGPNAISAVGITTQPKYILLSVILSLDIGITALVARRKGENDIVGANRCLKQGIIISATLSLIMTVLGFIFAKDIIRFAGAGNDIIGDATTYFQIILIGNFFASLGLTINAAQRGIGNTKISMRTNVVANIFNIVFDYLLIGGHFGFPHWGVAGAAVATLLGNVAGFVLSVRSVLQHDCFLNLRQNNNWRFDKRTVSGIFKVGSSAMVEQVFMRIGFFSYAKIVAGLGTVAFAAHQICINILNLSFSFGDGFSVAASSLVGQSLGEKRPDKAIIYAKVGQRFAFTVSVLLSLTFLAGNTLLVQIFSNDPQIIAMSRPLMVIIAITTLGQISTVVLSGCLRGAGDVLYTAWVSLLSIGIIRPLASWVLCYPMGLGLTGAWIGLLLDQMLRLFMVFLRFRGDKWTRVKL